MILRGSRRGWWGKQVPQRSLGARMILNFSGGNQNNGAMPSKSWGKWFPNYSQITFRHKTSLKSIFHVPFLRNLLKEILKKKKKKIEGGSLEL